MKLAPGTQLGSFEILGPLGAGGMGEVWRARDTRLQREVAIKVLPEALASDPERRARFEREARVLASLSHPHIGALLALEEAGGVPALVLELVEGPTLADRLAEEGARPAAEVVAVARAIADAMEYAHELGVVHRDLKPANIKFTRDDVVKVLDFGLAKALAADADDAVDASLTHSPTRTMGTQAGVLLGTAAYMAPEQARGKRVDRRADIWAFGVVVFEMLAGRQLFAGETLSDTIARILEREPDWSLLPEDTPRRLVALLRRCLVKDPRARLRDIGDARLELEAIASGTEEPGAPAAVAAAPGTKPRWLAIGVAVVLGGLAGAALVQRIAPDAPWVRRTSVTPPRGVTIRNLTFIEGGRALVGRGSVAPSTEGGRVETHLYRRALDSFEWTAIPGTAGVVNYDVEVDDRWIHFVAPPAPGSPRLRMVRVPTDGGSPPSEVCEWDESYGPWDVLADGRILVTRASDRAFAILAKGQSVPERWTPLVTQLEIEDLWIDSAFPDGRAALASVGHYASSGWTSDAVAIDLKTGNVTVLVANAANPRMMRDGTLLVGREQRLLAAKFDRARLRISGEPVAVLEGVQPSENWGHAIVSVSEDGTLCYRPAGTPPSERRLALLDAAGRWSDWSGERHQFAGEFAMTAEGGRVVATVLAPGSGTFEMLVFEQGAPGSRRLLPATTDDQGAPCLSRDGRLVAFQRGGSDSLDGVYVVGIDGVPPARKLLESDRPGRRFFRPSDWLPDGSGLLLTGFQKDRASLVLLSMTAAGAAPVTLLAPPFDVSNAKLSPDGRTLAFVSRENGRNEVRVTRFEGGRVVGNAAPVTRDAVRAFEWAPSGRTLWCVSDQRTVSAHDIGEDLRAGPARAQVALADEAVSQESVKPLAGGGLLVVRRADGEGGPSRFDLVTGFDRELGKRLAAARGGGR